jgi:hypothetical protein
MDDGGFGNEDNGGFGNEDGGFGNEENGIENEEDNDRDVLNEYFLERMRLYQREENDEVSVGAGSGGGGGRADEAVANKAADVAVAAARDDEAVGPPLLLGELVDATIVFPADDDAHADDDDDLPIALSIPCFLLSGSALINTPVAEGTRRQYNHENADFMMYLWDDRPELLSIPAMELLNRAWESIQRSCFKSSEAYDQAVVQNMKKARLSIVLNPAHDPVDFDNLNSAVFAD